MPSNSRFVCIAFQLLALSATLSVAPSMVSTALASPIAMPMPLADAVASRTRSFSSHHLSPSVAPVRPSPKRIVQRSVAEADGQDSQPIAPRKIKPASGDRYAKMKRYGDDAKRHATNYKRHAARSSSVPDDDAEFQRQCASELSGYHSSILGLQELFRESGREKGLANYDDNNDIETLLKDLVDYHKDVLAATTVLAYNIPLLGPLLGPIMYEIKCIIDLLLDTTENLTDGVLNAIGLNLALSGQTAKTTCLLGGGLC